MKLDINIPDHNIKLAKYLAGEMDTSERQEFEQIISAHNENELLVKEMRNDWKRIGSHRITKDVDVDKAWSNVFTKLDSESLLSTPKELSTQRFGWVKWAAAAALIIGISSALLTEIWKMNQEIVVQTHTDPSTLVHPLPDGSVVYLANNSTLSYFNNFGKESRKISLQGEAFFDVSPNKNIPFQIETGDALIKVLGTSFTVKANQPGNFELIVETGTVSISSKEKDAQTLIAQAGDWVTIVDNRFTKTTTIDKSHLQWKNKRLQFKDETISTIIQVINKDYGTNIILEPSHLGGKRITVSFQNSNISSIVEVICATLNLDSKHIDNTIILSLPADAK
jgi:ferric-dicitrate binding protein FerR (iron transport regulator)